jgi:sterol desaturase/sphingolipid hydroxylase (fatty acid hydroxylase superfamily)
MDVVKASIPLFFLLIGLEVAVARVRRRPLFRLSDSISDLSCGILSQLAGIGIALATIAAFAWVSRHLAIQHFTSLPEWISRNPFPASDGFPGVGVDAIALASWGVVFLLDDFAYYWMHRLSHVVNILWAGHVVHHSSEEFNLTVALRQSSLHGFMSWVFYMPLALLGVPVTMWLICHALNLVYQFWIHTREVDRLGPLEWVINTPSHHRVHHGVNPEYQDKNFAGTFIIWDRLFGTFEPERAPVVYGITKPLASWNPVWANVHVFADIARNVRAARGLRNRLRAVFGHPGWRPPELGAPTVPGPVSPESFVKFEPQVPGWLRLYALVQFVVVLVGSVALLEAAGSLRAGHLMAGVFYIAVSLVNIGGVLEARSWASVSEVARLTVLGGAAALLWWQGTGPAWLLAAAMVFAAASVVWVVVLRPRFGPSDARPILVM